MRLNLRLGSLLTLATLLLVTHRVAATAADLIAIEDCTLVPTEWADGDSFLVRTPDGEEHTVRLYGVDCMEWHVTDPTDSRRLRSQRRYFGITTYGDSPGDSIDLAKGFGERAYQEVLDFLDRPFTLHTAFADARGDGKYRRIYGFIVSSDGENLAEHLVEHGLARAFGVARQTHDGRSKKEFEAHLADLELLAARSSRGIWAATNWETLANERMEERLEDEELALATGGSELEDGETLDLNTAARDQLMRLPRIGEALANRIIEARPFESVEELLRVDGIGEATLEGLRGIVEVSQD